MAAGQEIANAYVSLIVKAEGTKKRVEAALGEADAEGAGKKLGDQLGTGITTRQAAIAGAVGGIFASVANMAVGALGNLFGEAVAASDATDKFAQTLNFAGLDTSAIDGAMSKARSYADATVYDLSTIQNTTAQLAANGIENYSELTEAAGNLNAVAGGNADTFSSVAMMLTQTAGAGKLTTENWNQLADAIPGASGRLQEAMADAGAYTGNFRDAMAEGQITADEFNAALLELGSEPVAAEAATSVTTMEGAVGNLQAAIVGGLSDAFTAIKPVLTEIVNGLAGFVSFIQANISWIGPLAAGVAIVAGAIAVWTVAQWALNAALTANPIGLIIVGIGLLIGAIILLVQNWDTVVAWISSVWGGFIGWITDGLNAFVGWWNGLWAGVGAWISGVWNGIVAGVMAYFTSLWNGLVGIGAAISGWWNGLWSGIASFFGGIWGGILGAIENVQAAFGRVFNAIASIVRGAFDGVASVVRGVINSVIDAVNGAIGGINGVAGAIGGALGIDISIPKIPRLAKGGIVSGSSSGTLALIGEAGRGRDEAVVPLPPDWRTNGIGGGSPSTLVFVDSDGRLIGSMKAAAASVVESAQYRSAVKLSGGGVSA